MTVNERVCRNVKALCKINHVQLAEVEHKLGKHPGFFSRRPKVTPDMMIVVADYFEMTIDDLMKVDFEKVISERKERENIAEAIYCLKDKLSKDEMMKEIIHIVNYTYDRSEAD